MKLCFVLVGFCISSFAANAQFDRPVLEGSGNVDYFDYFRRAFVSRADSLTQLNRSFLYRLDSSRSSLQIDLDSLSTNSIEANNLRHTIDSLNQLTEKTIIEMNNDLESFKRKTIGELNQKIDELGLPSDLTQKFSNLTDEIEKFDISSVDPGVAQVLPSGDIPIELKNLKLNTSVPPLTGGTNAVEDITADVGVPGEVTAYGTKIQQLANADPNTINTLSSTAEQKAAELSGITGIQKEADVLDEYQSKLTDLRDPTALKEQGVEKLEQAAMDHFAGKGQVLQEAMDKMGKYKDKYASLTSLTDLPFKRPNEMRGKPLIERIVPAFMFQIQKEGNNLLVDINPYAGYRFTGKLTAGAGWNQRIGYDTKLNDFNSKPRIYGPRVFGEYNLWKGFSPRIEVEVMNALVAPENQPSRMDLGTREWVWGAFIGLKKEYRFIKNVKGTALVMTRLFDPDHKSPYANILNVRIGFEFPMKKKLHTIK